MWVWLSVCSAVLLGVYDVAKKQALKRNGVLWVLLVATALSALFMSPCLSAGPLTDHLKLVAKACLVTASWVSGLIGLKLLPLTTVSTIKASRPVFVVAFSIILFGERLNIWQWIGVIVVFTALWLLSRSSRKEGISFTSNKGVAWMAVSVLTGAASALYDKHIMASMEPLFVQSWCNLYITAILGIILIIKKLREKSAFIAFKWDWTLVIVALLITIADALYFFALKQEGAMLSVISLVRRCSVIVTFVTGALLFKEKNLRSKALVLLVLLIGMTIIVIGTK